MRARYSWTISVVASLLLVAFTFPTFGAQVSDQGKKLCSCQVEEGVKSGACFGEVLAECTRLGEAAKMVEMCWFDWSDPAALAAPDTFMAIIKASAVKCKHPYEFNVTEMASFLGATGMEALKNSFIAQEVNGAMMTKLTLEQLTDHLNSTLGRGMMFVDVLTKPLMNLSSTSAFRRALPTAKKTFLMPGPPVNVGKLEGRDNSTVSLSFNVKHVSEIDEVKFEFKATFDVIMHWTDVNVWSDCQARGAEIDEGACQYVWRPKLSFPNAKELDIVEETQELWADTQFKAVTYQFEVFGLFAAPMSFRTFPADTQTLPITVAIINDDPMMAFKHFRLDPVAAQLDARITATEGGKDTISGWKVQSATAKEHAYIPTDWEKLAGNDGPLRRYLDGMIAQAAMFNVTVDILEESKVSAVTCEVKVERTTVFYMLNYIMVVILLTSLSWITFVMDPSELGDRCGISLTLLLALNVFQLILSELMPKTGYLTPMHEFVIVSTFFTVLAAVESVASHVFNKRAAVRAAVVDKLTNMAAASESAANVEKTSATAWRRKANSKTAEGVENDEEGAAETWVPVESHRVGRKQRQLWPIGGWGGPITREAVDAFLAENIDRASLVLFPITYAAYTASVFW